MLAVHKKRRKTNWLAANRHSCTILGSGCGPNLSVVVTVRVWSIHAHTDIRKASKTIPDLSLANTELLDDEIAHTTLAVFYYCCQGLIRCTIRGLGAYKASHRDLLSE